MMSPAPGFDEHIPHDLVHYVVEAELGLDAGVLTCVERALAGLRFACGDGRPRHENQGTV